MASLRGHPFFMGAGIPSPHFCHRDTHLAGKRYLFGSKLLWEPSFGGKMPRHRLQVASELLIWREKGIFLGPNCFGNPHLAGKCPSIGPKLPQRYSFGWKKVSFWGQTTLGTLIWRENAPPSAPSCLRDTHLAGWGTKHAEQAFRRSLRSCFEPLA